MKEYKLIMLGSEYYIRANKHYVAEPGAIRGVHNMTKNIKDMFIIANDMQDAQNLLMKHLKPANIAKSE